MTILKEMHYLDPLMTQCQRIRQLPHSDGNYISSMTNDELVNLELDTRSNLKSGTIRIVDIVGGQYGKGVGDHEYTGIFPMFVSAPMALYYQSRIKNTLLLDDVFALVDTTEGIEVAADWYRESDPMDDLFKHDQRTIALSIA